MIGKRSVEVFDFNLEITYFIPSLVYDEVSSFPGV